MNGGDGALGLLAVRLAPALREPGRRIEFLRISFRKKFIAPPHEIAQYAVHQSGEGRRLWLQPRGAHREIDRRVIGRVKEKNLRRRRNQQPFETLALARQSLLEQHSQSMSDDAEPSKRDGRDRTRQRRVARIEPLQTSRHGRRRKTLVEPMTALHHIGDDVSRRDSRRQAGNFRRLGVARRFSGNKTCARFGLCGS